MERRNVVPATIEAILLFREVAMHPEQVEAIVQQALEDVLGDPETIQNMQTVLRRTNIKVCPEESKAAAQNAMIIQSLFLSHSNLARVTGNLAEAAQRLQERIVTLESTIGPLQEAVINLQLRVKTLEDAGGASVTP